MLAAARADKMPCMAVRDGNEDESEQRIGKDAIANRRLAPCRFYRCNDSRGEHSEHDLEKGGMYFFLLVTPADPGSFVGVSSVTSTTPRLPPPPRYAAATASAGTPRRPPPRTGAAATASAGTPRRPPPLTGDTAPALADTPRRPPPLTGTTATASSGSFSKYLTFLPHHLIKCSPAYLRGIL
jgi:hypothetical protein